MDTEALSFQVVSDIHLEFRNDMFEIIPKSPYLALLGDIGLTTTGNLTRR
jgi:hypothetical protein